MTKDNVFTSVITKNDFEETLRGVIYTENDNPDVGEWAYDDLTRSVHINANDTHDSFVRLRLGYLYAGDTVDVSTDFLYVSGILPRIMLNRYPNENYENYPDGRVEESVVKSDFSPHFKKHTMRFSVYKDGAFELRIGLIYSAAGEFKMRNLAVNVNSISSNLSGSNMRKAMINFTSKGNPSIDTRFSKDIASLTVVDEGLSLMITFEPPFSHNGKLIGFVSNEWTSYSKNYIPRLSSAENHSAKIRIFSLTTNEPVPISEVPIGVFVPVLLINAKK